MKITEITNQKPIKSQITKQAIITSAVEIFYNKGFTLATLEEIAHHANLTRGAIYWHFKNKTEIFEELHQISYQPVAETIQNSIPANQAPNPIEILRQCCLSCISQLAQDPFRQKILTIFFLKCDYTNMDHIIKIQQQRKHDTKERFSQYFHHAKQKNCIKTDLDPECITKSLLCLLTGIVIEYLRHQTIDIKSDAPKLINLFFDSIRL